jgi:hypothetical protein
LEEFYKWLIIGWSMVVLGIAALGTLLIVKYGEIKKIETDDISLCFIIAFFCWLIPIIAFSILARTLGM